MRPICRHISNNDFYEYKGDDIFTNIRTGVSGKVDAEKAKKVFRFNLEATEIINQYPMVELLIKTLNLKCDGGVVGMRS